MHRNRQLYMFDAIKSNLKTARENLWPQGQPPILFVGNGISRMIANTPGWDALFRNPWLDPKIEWSGDSVRMDYSLAEQQMSYSERASYLLSNLPAAARRQVLSRLFDESELKPLASSPLAKMLLENFPVIVTTNFDNLLERHARDLCLGFTQINVRPGADKPELTSIAGKGNRAIVKIHGSFPLEHTGDDPFEHWWKGYAASEFNDELVLTYGAYQERMRKHDQLYDEVAKEIDYFYSEAVHPREPIAVTKRGALIAGYGLAFDDMSITALLTKIASGPRSVIEFGAEPVFRHRALHQWGVKREVAIFIPNQFGAGPDYRRWAHEVAFRDLLGQSADDLSVPVSAHRSVLLLGQASVNYVTRLETMPQAERSYTLRREEKLPPQLGNLAGADWEDGSIKSGEAVQVGGQMLVPAMFLDALGHPTHLVSVIADDMHGERVRRALRSTRDLDWSLVCSLPPWHSTEHAYVLSVEGVRTILDFAQTKLEDAAIFRIEGGDASDHTESALALNKALWEKFKSSGSDEERAPNLGAVYLSKWFARELQPTLRKIKAKTDVPFLYETGSRGSQELKDYDTNRRRKSRPVEAVVGDLFDGVLASSLFAMRMACVDFRGVIRETNFLEDRPLAAKDTPIPILTPEAGKSKTRIAAFDDFWADLAGGFGQFWAKERGEKRLTPRELRARGANLTVAQRRERRLYLKRYSYELAAALQMHAFLKLVERFGPAHVHRMIFHNPNNLFPKAAHFCVSLGSDGAMLFHREEPDRILWAVAPVIEEVSTLGCGDVARAGYLSAMLDVIGRGELPFDRRQFTADGAAGVMLKRFAVMGTVKSRFLDVEAGVRFAQKQLGPLTGNEFADRRSRRELIDRLAGSDLLGVAVTEITARSLKAFRLLSQRSGGVDTIMRDLIA